MDEQHEFSCPWDDSDLILIVEDQKLHVHRFILKMASPVFKAMLSSDFKEKNENELPLRGKKANEIVDLLRQIYPQFGGQITLQNVEYIYRIADEYQMKGVADSCRQFLTLTKKTSENAMEVLVLAQLCDTAEVRKQCYEELEHFTVAQLKLLKGFTDMDERSLRSVLLSKAEKLEKCLGKVLPQFCGLMDCVLYSSSSPKWCPVHYSNNITKTMMNTRIHCDTCKVMFTQMAKTSFSAEQPHDQTKTRPVAGGVGSPLSGKFGTSAFGGAQFQQPGNCGANFSFSSRTPAVHSGPTPAMPKEQQLRAKGIFDEDASATRRVVLVQDGGGAKFHQPDMQCNSFQFGPKLGPAMPKEQQLPGPYYSKCGIYFDENIVSILQEMFDLLKLEDKQNIQV